MPTGQNGLIDPVAPSMSAVQLKYIRAQQESDPEPHAPLEGMGLSKVESNMELVDPDTPMPRAMRLVTFTLPPGHYYRPGDHVEVFPENDE